MVSSNANSHFTDENTQESLVRLIKPCGYILVEQSSNRMILYRVHAAATFFFPCHPTYGVSPEFWSPRPKFLVENQSPRLIFRGILSAPGKMIPGKLTGSAGSVYINL